MGTKLSCAKHKKSLKKAKREREPCIAFVHTTNLPALFQDLQISLLVTTYQAQRVMTFSAPSRSKMFMLMRVFPRPTGVAIKEDELALCSMNQIWFFRLVTNLRDDQGKLMPYDYFLAPRRSHVTGDIAAHQLAWHRDELLIVNTRFSCLCTLDEHWSFVPGWKPPFISSYAPEDRCHLNGFCLDEHGPKYATALGATDQPGGWRENKARGGILMEVPSGEIVAHNLSMPHTPMLYRNQLWVLESGSGSLLTVDPKSGLTELVVRLPGFLRGLSFFDKYAFIGLCQIREKSNFGGLPIEAMFDKLKCAIYVVDITTGTEVGLIEFTKGVEELFDIQVLPGVKNPHILGFEEETINQIMVIPPQFVGACTLDHTAKQLRSQN
ncbi:MAG: TIGR03032 family protein [Deltaproteobacteria bacterium]|nr:TIGR03032 family protein [Deltaproteobacteria bacterium]